MRTAERLLLLAALALAPVLRAEDAPSRRLGAPVAMKLDWGVNAIRSADIDGDGRTDLAMLNNDTGRIEILLRLKPGEKAPSPRTLREDRWTPKTDDAPYRRLSLTGSVDMGSLELADLDGSKRIQIAYTSSRDGLTVVTRDKDGEWTVRKSFTRQESVAGSGSLASADLDGSGRKQLLMLSKAGILVFPKFVPGEDIPEPKLYRTGSDSATNLDVADLDGDGVADITYIVRGDKPELHVRFGLKSGGFGPERSFPTEYYSTDFTHNLAVKGGPGYPGLSFRKRSAEIFNLSRDNSSFAKADAVSPALYSTPSPLRTPTLVALMGDAMYVADPRGASVQVYKREASGDFGEPVGFPAPANLKAIIATSAPAGVIMLGEKDDAPGFAGFDDKGRLAFPKTLTMTGTALALGVTSSADGKTEELLVVTKNDKKVSLLTFVAGASGTFEQKASVELDSSAKDTEGLLFGVIGDKRVVVVLCGRSAALLLKETDKGYAEFAKDSTIRKTMLSGVGAGDLGFGAPDGKTAALLVSAPGYVRSLTLDEKGELVVKDQFNTRRPGDKPRCPFVATLPGEKDPGLFFYNDTDKGIEWLAPDDKGVFRHKRTVLTGALDPSVLVEKNANADPLRRIFAGRERIADVDLRTAGMKLAVLDRFETDLPEIVHLLVATGNFTGGKTTDMALIDPRAHQLELVSRDASGAWKSRMNFRLFDDNPFYRGRRSAGFEPHDGLVADIDGDGFDDLVLLMHDRLLIYPSEAADKSAK